jgi:hypothetical protein
MKLLDSGLKEKSAVQSGFEEQQPLTIKLL